MWPWRRWKSRKSHWPPGARRTEALPAVAAERLRTWWQRAQRVYPSATLKAWRCDGIIFADYCSARQLSALPATPETVAGFVLHCKESGKKPATVRRYLSTIARLHRAVEMFNPCSSEVVQMELKGMTSKVSSRQRQAKGLGMAEIQAFLDSQATIFRPSVSGRCYALRTTL